MNDTVKQAKQLLEAQRDQVREDERRLTQAINALDGKRPGRKPKRPTGQTR